MRDDIRDAREYAKFFETYKIVVGLLSSEGNLNWQRLYNSLVANSIVLAAWAVVLTQGNMCKWLRAPLLLLISLFGLILTTLWASATARGNTYHRYWLLRLNFLEDKIGKGESALVDNIFQQMPHHMRLLDLGKTIRVEDFDCPIQPEERSSKDESKEKWIKKWLTLHWLNPKALVPQKILEQREMANPIVPAIRVMDYFSRIPWLFIILYLLLFIFSVLWTITG